jgi:hypothetical protein
MCMVVRSRCDILPRELRLEAAGSMVSTTSVEEWAQMQRAGGQVLGLSVEDAFTEWARMQRAGTSFGHSGVSEEGVQFVRDQIDGKIYVGARYDDGFVADRWQSS